MRAALSVLVAFLQASLLFSQDIAWVQPGFSRGAISPVIHSNLLFTGAQHLGPIQVWDLAQRKFIKSLHANYGGLPVSVSSDGRWLLARGFYPMVWNLADASFRYIPNRTNSVYPDKILGFQTQSNRVALLGEDNRIHFWDLATETYLSTPAQAGIHSVPVVSRDGERAGVYSAGDLRIYSLSTLEYQSIPIPVPTTSFIFSPDGNKVAGTSHWNYDQTTNQLVYVYDVGTLSLENTLTAAPGEITGLAFKPGERILAAHNASGVLTLWNLEKNAVEHQFPVPADSFSRLVAFSADGSTLMCGGSIVHQQTGALERLVHLFYRIDSMAVNDDGSLLVTQSAGQAHLWDARTGRVLQSLRISNSLPALRAQTLPPSDNVEPYRYSSIMREHRPIHFEPGGRRVIIGNAIFNISDGAQVASLPDTTTRGWVSAHASGWFYKSYYNGDIAELLSYQDGSVIRRLQSPLTGGSSAIATSASGRFIASSGFYLHRTDFVDSRIRIWNSSDGSLITTLHNLSHLPFRLVFSRDESLVASGADLNNPELAVWDIPNRRQLLSLRDRVSPALGFDLLPDSRTLAYGTIDRLEFWDSRTSQRLYTITNEASFISAVAASPDGNTVFAGRMDGTVIAYRTPPFHYLALQKLETGEAALKFQSRSGTHYELQVSNDLSSWTTLANLTGSGSEITVPLTSRTTSFYRLR